MLAFAHSDIHNAYLHAMGDVAVILTLIALGICVYALIDKAYRNRAPGSTAFMLASMIGIVFSFKNFHSYAVFTIASVWAFAFAIVAIAHLFKPMNRVLPRALQAA